jgi:DNA-binding NarL/FixJ family response regulator
VGRNLLRMDKLRILLADDHTIVRQGLRVLLEAEPDIVVVGEAGTGREAVQLAAKLLPDIAVVDIAMPVLNGLEATRQIIRDAPSTKVLVLSSYSDDEYLYQVTEAGAAGYLVKQSAAADLITAVREVRKGNAFFSPSLSKRLLERCRDSYQGDSRVRERAVALTSREAEVLQLIAEGKANKQIAADLNISIKTVQKHRQQLMNKVKIHNVASLTRYAIARGVVESKPALRC